MFYICIIKNFWLSQINFILKIKINFEKIQFYISNLIIFWFWFYNFFKIFMKTINRKIYQLIINFIETLHLLMYQIINITKYPSNAYYK